MLTRIYAIFLARNREFIRDRGTLAWNIVLPVALVLGLSFAFGGDGKDEFTIGILQQGEQIDRDQHPFLKTRFIDFVVVHDERAAFRKIEHHQLDLLVRFDAPASYWVNPESPKGYFAERLLLQADGPAQEGLRKEQISGKAIRYAEWVLPGILGMNMMFSSLFGVGYVVVRYRKNGFLKRLRATPLQPLEFIIAQVSSRLVLIMAITVFVYLGTHWLLDTRMEGSYLTLFLIATLGAISLISLGLLVSARVTSEELAGGLLNLINWPMMLLSGVWFSLEGAGDTMRALAQIFPLTHILDASRAVMLDGAVLADVLPHVLALTAMSVVFLGLGATLFRWTPK
ncbi:MAG TPA: ABC transporter permease [Woeseiaceae bacterium]|nr:ABC transporter permease [Woeseiaceae bacterium]